MHRVPRVRTTAIGAAAAVLSAWLAMALPAAAQDVAGSPAPAVTPAGSAAPAVISLVATYPSVVIDPGGEAKFTLIVTGPNAERVDLAVTGAPEGFETSFRGGGAIVRSVTIGGEEPPDLELRVAVPDDAASGDVPVTVTGTAASGVVELPLAVVVSDDSGGSVTLSTDYPNLEGASDDTFSFDLDLANDTAQDLSFGLEGQGPEGWDVNVRPSTESQAATTQVAAGDSGTIRVTVTPAARAEAGATPIVVRALNDDYPAETTLSVKITGTYAMSLESLDGRLNTSVTSGSSTQYGIIVFNTGTAPLTDVALSADTPLDWEVTFEPETLAVIEPGGSAQAVAAMTPAGTSVAGDYQVTMSASSADADDDIAVRVTVETSNLWGIVSIAIIVLVVVGLALVFRRYGRR